MKRKVFQAVEMVDGGLAPLVVEELHGSTNVGADFVAIRKLLPDALRTDSYDMMHRWVKVELDRCEDALKRKDLELMLAQRGVVKCAVCCGDVEETVGGFEQGVLEGEELGAELDGAGEGCADVFDQVPSRLDVASSVGVADGPPTDEVEEKSGSVSSVVGGVQEDGYDTDATEDAPWADGEEVRATPDDVKQERQSLGAVVDVKQEQENVVGVGRPERPQDESAPAQGGYADAELGVVENTVAGLVEGVNAVHGCGAEATTLHSAGLGAGVQGESNRVAQRKRGSGKRKRSGSGVQSSYKRTSLRLQKALETKCKKNKCDKQAQERGFCIPHGKSGVCSNVYCSNKVSAFGVCKAHSGKFCVTGGGGVCRNQRQARGLCVTHGGGRVCEVQGCDKHRQGGQRCDVHQLA
jgi:hypothetical protein